MSDNTYDKDFWNQRYNTESYLYGEAPNEFLVENLSYLKNGGKILCLSEGEGRNAVHLATQGYQVTGVDQSSVAKEKAIKLADKHKVEIHYDIANIRDYDLGEDKWDGIVSIFAHTPSSLRRQLHQKIKKALKPDGVLLLEGYSIDQIKYETGGPKNLDMLYSKEDLAQDFGDLHIIKLEKKLRTVIEGSGHTGEASVVQFVLRK